VAGNFSAYWLGFAILSLMSIGYFMSTMFLVSLMLAPAVFAFGLVAFGFLGMGPVTIAVDSYGPVTDNAQSVYELSTIEPFPTSPRTFRRISASRRISKWPRRTWKRTMARATPSRPPPKPVLIGTAVVGATTMIFSIIVALTHGLEDQYMKLISLMHAPFLLGLIAGGAVIYWFTGASAQAVTTGAYRAVEFISGTSISRPPRKPPWPIPRRWWRSARSTRRRAC